MDDAAVRQREERKRKIMARSDNRLATITATFAGKEDDETEVKRREEEFKSQTANEQESKVSNGHVSFEPMSTSEHQQEEIKTLRSSSSEGKKKEETKAEYNARKQHQFLAMKTFTLVSLSVSSFVTELDSTILATLLVLIESINLFVTRKVSIKGSF